MLLRFVVVVVAFEIEHVFIEFILGLSYLVFLTYYFLVARLLHFFIFVAIVIPASLLTMFLPVSQTEPTEFMRTQLTCHVVASLILLNSTFALRTCLCIGHNPSNVFTFIRILGFPHVSGLTCAWPMRFLRALETEGVSAFAMDITNPVFFIFNTIVAALEGTPSHIFVVISE